MARNVTVAATQMACSWDREANLATGERLVRAAHGEGAQVILLQELFETPYFCQQPNEDYMLLATPLAENPAVQHFQTLARELQVVLPISYFELAGRARFNSVAIIDADGSVLGNYRKSHIPDGPGYHEKFYFNPGDTGFRVWNTRYGKLGVAICWDQWFPESARSMPLIASNRIGREQQDDSDITFYGGSFIADHTGAMVEVADGDSETVLVHSFDLDEIEKMRTAWGVFRDRRPPLYQPINTLDGEHA